ncbi:MAG: hypothetical protein IK062_07250, partial [Selenomonadaceae bacterium]|nr:hypothetical protein [Selenomonadaceae bacterium]
LKTAQRPLVANTLFFSGSLPLIRFFYSRAIFLPTATFATRSLAKFFFSLQEKLWLISQQLKQGVLRRFLIKNF